MFSATLETLYTDCYRRYLRLYFRINYRVVLFLTAPNQLLENKWINRVYQHLLTFLFNSICHFNHSFVKLYKILSWDGPWAECSLTSFNYRSAPFLWVSC